MWKKIICLGLLYSGATQFCLAFTSSTWQLSGNMTYATWPAVTAQTDQYYFKTWRDHQWYQPRDIDTTYKNKTVWTLPYSGCGRTVTGITLSNKNQSMLCDTTTYTLSSEQRDFANLSFTYQISGSNGWRTWPENLNLPIARVDLCGAIGFTYLEALDARSVTPTTVTLPNPGTCDDEHHELTISILPLAKTVNSAALVLSNFTLATTRWTADDILATTRHDEQSFALLTSDYYTLECQDKLCFYDQTRRGQTAVVGEIGGNDQVCAHGCYSENFSQAATASAPDLVTIVRESDDTLTIFAKTAQFSPAQRQNQLEIGLTTSLDWPAHNWAALTPAMLLSRASYGAWSYVSSLNGWQIVNYVLPAGFDWATGFYLQARTSDHWGQLSHGSQFYFCQDDSCTKATTPAQPPFTFSEIYFGDESHAPYILITQNDQQADLSQFLITTQPEVGTLLNEAELLSSDNGQNVWRLAWPDLRREHVALQLYTTTGQLIDNLDYGTIAAPLGLRRQIVTSEWKEVYVSPNFN